MRRAVESIARGVAVVLLALSFAEAQAPQPQQKADRIREFLGLGKPVDAAAAARGSTLYAANCAFCHGAKAAGAEGPNLVQSSLVLHDDDGDKIGPLLWKGRPDRGMPAFPSLTAEQTRDVAAFLHQRVESVANRGTYQLQNIVTGNRDAGAAYFSGAGHCTQCHSATGDLLHIGSKYPPPDLQAAFLYPAAVSSGDASDSARQARDVAVTLPDGEVVRGKLRHLDDFEVALTDASGVYRSWPRTEGVRVEVADPLAEHRALLAHYTDADMHNLLSYLVTLK